MKLRSLLLAATLAALAAPAAAGAALEVRLSLVPAKPRAGKQTVVQLRPYWTYLKPDGTCCRLEPADVNYPFRVEAVSPNGRVYRIRVRRTANRYVWAGRFAFARAGRWTVREPHWGPTYSTRAGGRPQIRPLVGR